MFKKVDPYSYSNTYPLYNGDNIIGLLAVEYTARLYNDVMVLNSGSSTPPANQQFLITCTQRFALYNKNTNESPQPSEPQYKDYPVLLNASMILLGEDDNLTLNLLDFSPKTVNTAVQQGVSNSDSDGKISGVSTASTTGSSQFQSSTYGASVSVGTFGDLPVTDASASYSYTTGASTEQSATHASDASSSLTHGSEHSASMSVKDWGSYGAVNPELISPEWVFGQEYPWNAIDCRFYDANSTWNNQSQLYVAADMLANLFSTDSTNQPFLYPPSELSLYGVSFVTKAHWRLYLDYESSSSTEISVNHSLQYFSASHKLVGGYPVVYMDNVPSTLRTDSAATTGYAFTAILDLNLMALDPVGVASDRAIVGFLPSKFIPPLVVSSSDPTSTQLPQGFKILAATNDLEILDTTTYKDETKALPFTASDTCLTVTWNSSASPSLDFPYQLTLYFKIVDAVEEYSLYVKHWITGSVGVILSITVNEATTITRYVTACEAEGGDNNLLTIALRDLDFVSIDYHDYLQLGLNKAVIDMSPIGDNYESCVYQIRAVAVGST